MNTNQSNDKKYNNNIIINSNKNILNEISTLSNNDLNNFELNKKIKFSDILNNFNHNHNEKKSLHIRNKTAFNFDFSKGTLNVTTSQLKDINEEKEENNVNIKFKEEIKIKKFKKSFSQQNIKNSNIKNKSNIIKKSFSQYINNKKSNKDIHSDDVYKISEEDDNNNSNRISEIKINNSEEDYNKKNKIIDNNIFDINNILKKETNEFIPIKNIISKNKTNTNIDIIENTERLFLNNLIQITKFNNDNNIINNNNNLNTFKKLNSKNSILSNNSNYSEINTNLNNNSILNNKINIFKSSKLKTLYKYSKNIISYSIDKDYTTKKPILYCGSNKGQIIIYDILSDTIMQIINDSFENNIIKKILIISTNEDYLVTGYSNGYISLYKKKDKIKLIKNFKHYSNTNILDIKIIKNDSNKNEKIIYVSDLSGKFYKIQYNQGFFSSSFNLTIIIDNNNNKYPFYNIELKRKNIYAIGNSIELNIYNNDKKVFNFKYNNNFLYLPCFYFLHKKFLFSCENFIYIYKCDEEYKKYILSITIALEFDISKIGKFYNDYLLYVFDNKNSKLTIININEYNNNVNNIIIDNNYNNSNEYFNNDIDISNLEIEFSKYNFINDNNFYPDYKNNFISNNKGMLFIYSLNCAEIISFISAEDIISDLYKNNYISNNNSEEKIEFSNIFKIIEDIYYNKNMYYKLNNFNNFNGFLIDICNSFLTIILQIYLNKNNNNINVNNELNYFIDFLFNIKLYDYIFKENLMYLTFKEFNYENLYLNLLENQILKNRLLQIENNEKNYLFINFIKKLFNKYNNNDNNYLCILLSYCNINLLLNFEIYELIEQNNLFNILIYIFYKYSGTVKFEDYKNININFYKPIEIINNLIRNNNLINEDINLNEEQYDFFNYKILFSKKYLNIKIYWYINIMIEKYIEGYNNFNKNDNNNIIVNNNIDHCNKDKNNFNENLFKKFFNDIIKEIYNSNYYILNENIYFYIIEKIIKNNDIIKLDINIENIINNLYNNINKNKNNCKYFYLLFLNIFEYLNNDDKIINISNEIKLNILLFSLKEKDNNLKSKENTLINLFKSINNLTNEEKSILINECINNNNNNNNENNKLKNLTSFINNNVNFNS